MADNKLSIMYMFVLFDTFNYNNNSKLIKFMNKLQGCSLKISN